MADPATRDRLLDATWELVSGGGVDRLTLAAVGARAGVSRQAVYLHFGNRATLLTEMAARVDHTSGFRQELGAARALGPREAFRSMLRAWFAYLPTILPVALALEASWLSGGDGGEAYRDRMDDWRDGIRLAVRRLRDDGALAAGWTVDGAGDWTWATVHPTHYHHLVGERGWTPTEARRRLTASLEQGILRPEGGEGSTGPPAAREHRQR